MARYMTDSERKALKEFQDRILREFREVANLPKKVKSKNKRYENRL